jgi:hypothetical protein
MSSTRIRTRTALAALTAALALTSVAPAAHAKPNDWRYSRSVEAQHVHLSDTYCGDMQGLYAGDQKQIQQAVSHLDLAGMTQAIRNANDAHDQAKRSGCAWAWT